MWVEGFGKGRVEHWGLVGQKEQLRCPIGKGKPDLKQMVGYDIRGCKRGRPPWRSGSRVEIWVQGRDLGPG